MHYYSEKMKHNYWSCFGFLVLVFIQNDCHFFQVITADEDGFIRVQGVQFMLKGSPYYANGFNAYWLMYFAAQPSLRNKVSSAFQEAANHGLTLARTWAFSDGGYSPLQYSPGSYNEQMFQGLDFVICEAKKNGIKLILPLVNNYESFGGKKQYVEWARNQGQHPSSEDDGYDDFFTNPIVKRYYKNHIKTVLTRHNTISGVVYKDDPTIMAWELINEPRCLSDLSGNTMQSWISEMASYLKSIDGNHLLEVGLEGFYGSDRQQYNPMIGVGTDFIANNQIPQVDFATVHSYTDQWLPGSSAETQLSFLSEWVNIHIQDAENILHKPVLFAEFGTSSRDPSFSISNREEVFNVVYSAVFSSASKGGAAMGGIFWQLLVEGMDNMRDGYEIIMSQSPSTASLIAKQSQQLRRVRNMHANFQKCLEIGEGQGH